MKKVLSMILMMTLVMIPLTPQAIGSENVSGPAIEKTPAKTFEMNETCFACQGSGHCELCRGSGWFYACGAYAACEKRCATCGGEGALLTTYVISAE